jgi:antitoxin (DNA-binding transcriptional repressor) of toxin-antitoxin stability system
MPKKVGLTPSAPRHRLSQLIDRALGGEKIVICRGRKPVVTLEPIAAREVRDPLLPYPDLACMEILCDLAAPLSDEEWPEESR